MRRFFIGRQQWMLVVLLLCFLLRLIAIDHKPLHFDEGNNVYFGHLPLTQLLQVSVETADTDPPAHRYLLGFWMLGAGTSEFAVRLFSVFASVLTCAMLWRVCRQLHLSRRVALLAGVLWSMSPYVIDYAQEAKGYAFAAACALVAWSVWIDAAAREWNLRRLGAYVGAMSLMFATHYYTAPVFAMHWLWWLMSSTQSVIASRKFILRSIAAQLVSVVPAAIWLAFSLPAALNGARGLSDAADPLVAVLKKIVLELSMGRASDGWLAMVGAIALVMMSVAGALALRRAHRAAFIFALAGVAPIAFALILSRFVSFFYPRFLMYVMPQMCVAVAGFAYVNLHIRGRTLARCFFVFVFALLGAGAIQHYRTPIDTETDYRSLVSQMRPALRGGDRVLATYIWMRGMLQSYAPRAEQTLQWIKDDYSTEEMRTLEDLPMGARIWSLNFRRNADAPDARSVMWLRQNTAYAGEATISGTQAKLFVLPQENAAAKSAVFDNKIELRYAPIQQITLRSSDVISTSLTWSARESLPEGYAIFVHLRAVDGRVVAQRDGDAVNGLTPILTWKVGREVIDRRAMLLPRDLPQGEYAFVIGVYRVSNSKRLLTQSGADYVELASVRVTR